MARLVQPKVYLVGVTEPDAEGIQEYLKDTGQSSFADEVYEALKLAKSEGKSGSQIALASMFAKLCYKSLTLDKNLNVSKIRSIQDNVIATIKSGHGSVFEHLTWNFIITNCSRVYTHEQVRHRVGTAYSQTSGRYVSLTEIDLVLNNRIFDNDDLDEILEHTRSTERLAAKLRDKHIKPDTDFARKKEVTSEIRKIAPNGQSNELAFSGNMRILRNTIQLRTSIHAEYEIRNVYHQIVQILRDRFWLVLHGMELGQMKDGIPEYTNLEI